MSRDSVIWVAEDDRSLRWVMENPMFRRVLGRRSRSSVFSRSIKNRGPVLPCPLLSGRFLLLPVVPSAYLRLIFVGPHVALRGYIEQYVNFLR